MPRLVVIVASLRRFPAPYLFKTLAEAFSFVLCRLALCDQPLYLKLGQCPYLFAC